MKKLAIVTLTAALAASTGAAPIVDAQTTITTSTTNYIPLQVLEVKDGQFDEHGFAYFKLNIPQEGYYRLVGNDTKSYETAVTTEENAIKAAPLQAASKLQMLNKGTYYVKVKGQPNATYHFKFAERTFDLEKEWPVSTDTIVDGGDNQNVRYFPFYAHRPVSATLKLTEDKHIRFYSGRKESIQSLSLRNVATGKTYTAKKISDYTFSSNAPNGTYDVALNMTDEFIKNPFIGKARISYTLGNHFPLNTTISTEDTPFNTFTLNLKKDTKIQFTIMEPKGDKRGGGRFSIYDDQHNLVKRAHIQKGQASRTFTYTVKKGRYSIASSDMNIRTLVKDETNTTSKFTFKNNTLVHAATGKVVKGYQVYQKNLYKNGKLAPGRVKYGKVPDMKLYKDGILQKGLSSTKDGKYLFEDGHLAKGTRSFHDVGTAKIYKNGVLTNNIYIQKGNKLYDGNELKKGKFVILDGVLDGYFLSLYNDGHLAKGLHKGTYGKNGKTYLFEDGKVATAFYKGKVYSNGEVDDGRVLVKDTLYVNHKPYHGIYEASSDEVDSEMYDNGKFLYYVTLQTYLDQLEIIQQLDDDAPNWNEEVSKLVTILTGNIKKIEDGYGKKLIAENPPQLGEEDVYPYDEYAQKQLLQDVHDVKKRLQAIPHTEQAQTEIEKGIKSVYSLQKLHYENGALLDGAYEGNFYAEGRFIESVINHKLTIANKNYSQAQSAYKNNIEAAEDKETLTKELIEKLLETVAATQAVAIEYKNPVYPDAQVDVQRAKYALEGSVSDYRFIERMVETYHLSIDLTPLQQKMKQASEALELSLEI